MYEDSYLDSMYEDRFYVDELERDWDEPYEHDYDDEDDYDVDDGEQVDYEVTGCDNWYDDRVEFDDNMEYA